MTVVLVLVILLVLLYLLPLIIKTVKRSARATYRNALTPIGQFVASVVTNWRDELVAALKA
jgi:hypothetical protein